MVLSILEKTVVPSVGNEIVGLHINELIEVNAIHILNANDSIEVTKLGILICFHFCFILKFLFFESFLR